MPLCRITPANREALLARAADILQRGGVVVLPTDTVYGIAVHPDRLGALQRLQQIKGRPADKPIALLAADAAAIRAMGGHLPPAARRLARAFWPGALTLVLECHGGREGFRVPDHPLTRELLSAVGGLLRVSSANLAGAAETLTAGAAAAVLGGQVDLILDDGPAPGGKPSSVVEVVGTEWHLLRHGAIAPATLERAAAGVAAEPPRLLLFVCTGNTCRSPMAAALLQATLPCNSGWQVASAGVAAVEGLPATNEAQHAVAAMGASLQTHRSRRVTPALLERATLVVVMSRNQLEALRSRYPGCSSKLSLLGSYATPPGGDEIHDPIGGTLHDYIACRDTIAAALPGLRGAIQLG